MIDILFFLSSVAIGALTQSVYSTILIVPSVGYLLYNRATKDRKKIDALGLLTSGENNVKNVESHVDKYLSKFGESRVLGSDEHKKLQSEREQNYAELVNQFYDIATDFYEYGWGQSFHFAPRFVGEKFHESIRRHEYYLAARLGLKAGLKCADIGCGVGGPARNIARFSGANVVGVNNNDYQLKIAKRHNEREKMDGLVQYKKTDFMRLPFDDAEFDAAYQIEATCHAPDLVACFKEIKRILKPGGVFCGYEWLMTKEYNPKNQKHLVVKQGIEQGNGIPNLRTIDEVVGALHKAGFVVEEHFDKTPHPPKPNEPIAWWVPLAGDYSWDNIRSTYIGRAFTTVLTYVLETLRIAPKGTYKVQCMLVATADDLVRGGEIGIFTPAYFYVARKPLNDDAKSSSSSSTSTASSSSSQGKSKQKKK